MIRAASLAVLLTLSACAQNTASDAIAAPAIEAGPIVIVVRHLEKKTGDDPSLTEIGAANAQALAERLADRDVKAIFSTPYKRTMETAAPLASRLGLSVTAYDPRDPAALVSAVRAVGGNVLVVGHSNTVPDLIARFGGPAVPVIDEATGYGTIYAVDAEGGLEIAQIK